MAIIRYQVPLLNLQHEINRMFEEFDRPSPSEPAESGMFRPAVDVREDRDAYVVTSKFPACRARRSRSRCTTARC
jgi:HSP20 family molecular chaperone IbpA